MGACLFNTAAKNAKNKHTIGTAKLTSNSHRGGSTRNNRAVAKMTAVLVVVVVKQQ